MPDAARGTVGLRGARMGLAGGRTRTGVGRAVAATCAALPLLATTACSATGVATADQVFGPPQVDDPRPNIVLVLADDLGYGDVDSGRFNEGNPNGFTDTPEIDRLAREGTAFPNGYAALSCAPSRTALLTGLYPQRPDNGVYGGRDAETIAKVYRGPRPRLRGLENGGQGRGSRLAAKATTVPELMAEAGYWNAHVGKFDVTRTTEEITSDHGFDRNYGGTRAGSPSTYTARPGKDGDWTWSDRIDASLEEFSAPYSEEYVEENVVPYSTGVSRAEALRLVGEPKNLTDAVGDAALASVDEGVARGGPFFVEVNHYAVHSPTGPEEARPDLLRKYQQRPLPRDRDAAYSAIVEGLDQAVGRLLDHLEETPDPRSPGDTLADNTIVVFMSDNGGRIRLNGANDEVSGGSNGPLRGEKFQLFEGGIRVPTAAWSGNPRLVRPNAVNRSIVHVTDVAATFAEAARVPRAARRALDGTSFARAMRSGADAGDPLLQHYPGYSLGRGRDERPASVLRQGSWKVRFDYEAQELRLYDIARDLRERRDLARARPALARRLGLAMATELERLDTPLATLKRRYAPRVIRVDRGDATYADGRLRRYERPTRIRVGAGDEMPLVVRRGGPGVAQRGRTAQSGPGSR